MMNRTEIKKKWFSFTVWICDSDVQIGIVQKLSLVFELYKTSRTFLIFILIIRLVKHITSELQYTHT